MEWQRSNDARVLVVANGSFLLNAALVNRARRPLALRVARWAGDEPMNVAFVEGSFVLGDPPAQPSVFGLLEIPPFGWLAAQLLALGLAVCLARAPVWAAPVRIPPPARIAPSRTPRPWAPCGNAPARPMTPAPPCRPIDSGAIREAWRTATGCEFFLGAGAPHPPSGHPLPRVSERERPERPERPGSAI